MHKTAIGQFPRTREGRRGKNAAKQKGVVKRRRLPNVPFTPETGNLHESRKPTFLLSYSTLGNFQLRPY